MRTLFSFRPLRETALSLLLVFTGTLHAQTLARPGWVGSGMNSAPWWRHAVFYRVNPQNFGGLHGVVEHLDYVHSVGVDALLLSALGGDAKQPIDPAVGTMEDVDEIVRRASQNDIRVLVELDASSSDLMARERFWLVHGIAGFYVPKASSAQIADLRRSAGGFAGQRIVLGDVDSGAQGRADAPQLVVDAGPGTQEKMTSSVIRPVLEATEQRSAEGQSAPLLLSDGPELKRSMSRYGDGTHDEAIAKEVAALLMMTRSGAMLYSGQELGLTEQQKLISFDTPKKGESPAPGSVAAGNASPSSLLNWYRQVSALTHSNRTMSTGAITVLNHDDQNLLVWVRKPQSASLATPAIVVLENLSTLPVTVSLKADMQRLHLRGSFLRTLLRSDNALGPMHLDGMTLPPQTVYLGELRY